MRRLIKWIVKTGLTMLLNDITHVTLEINSVTNDKLVILRIGDTNVRFRVDRTVHL